MFVALGRVLECRNKLDAQREARSIVPTVSNKLSLPLFFVLWGPPFSCARRARETKKRLSKIRKPLCPYLLEGGGSRGGCGRYSESSGVM